MFFIFRAIFYVGIVNLFVLPSVAYAYIDPGTGSLLLSIIISIFATGLFFIKGLIYKVTASYYKITGNKYLQKTKGLVFYSEGGQYWNVFKPVISALSARGEPCIYLTSDENDLGLNYAAPNVTSHYIGKGNRAYTQLNMLEADVCIMTTPGLDVYQLRRSVGVKHYAHVIHMPGEVSLYRRYSLDYYDSVLTSGLHQENSIRAIEAKRNILPKQIYRSGCAYYDVLLEKKQNLQTKNKENDDKKHILVAPTWGVNGLLTRYGMNLLKPLIDAKYDITIRPHPQSYTAELELIENLKSQTACCSHVQWDDSVDNFLAMSKADVLISDYSSITFDFSFVFERPALVLDFEPDLLPYDAYDIEEKPWEFSAQENIGNKITLEDLPNLPKIIQNITDNKDFIPQLRRFRDAEVYSFGNSADIIASQILEIKHAVLVEGKV